MKRMVVLTALALMVCVLPARAAGLTGKYVEARTCDVWTGPCFANAEMNLTGKHAVLGWKVDKGSLGAVRLDGLGVVAVVAAHDTLGLTQTGPARAVLIVDRRADAAQREALIRLARRQGGDLVRHVVAVRSAPIDFEVCACEGGGCAKLRAGGARIETRCLDQEHDTVCGNEYAFYPPLARNVKVRPALAVEHAYSGKGVNQTW